VVKTEIFVQRKLSGVNHELRILRAMLNVALENDWIQRLPNFAGLISQAAETTREIIPTEEEFARILDEVKNLQNVLYVLPIVLLLADSGARPIEVFTLLWDNVDLVNRKVIFTSDKGKRRTRRNIGITERTAEAIDALPRHNKFVLGGIKSIKESWNTLKLRADVQHIDLYHLRHLFATRIDKIEGLSEYDKMQLMGHSQLKTRAVYTKLLDETIDSVAEKLEANPYLPVQDLSDTVQ